MYTWNCGCIVIHHPSWEKLRTGEENRRQCTRPKMAIRKRYEVTEEQSEEKDTSQL